jgi:hypothetical protein
MMGSRLLATSILILLPALGPSALETTLSWRVGKDTVLFSESVEVAQTGVSATVTTSVGEYDAVTLDLGRSTLEWRRRVASEGTDVVAVRNGRRVELSGSYKGRPYKAAYDFGASPWYQLQEISYEALFASNSPSSQFWTIDRKTLKPSLFKAERGTAGLIDAMGAPVRAVGYSLTVAGVPAFIFTSHFWLRERDGRFLRLEVPAVLGLPRSSVELTSES